MDAAETHVLQTTTDAVHGFGLSSFYYSAEDAAVITMIAVVVLAEWVIYSAVTVVAKATAAANGLSF